MLVAGAKSATYGMREELNELGYLKNMKVGVGDGNKGGLAKFLWRESVKPTLKARLRMVQDDLMQGYVANAKQQLIKEKVG